MEGDSRHSRQVCIQLSRVEFCTLMVGREGCIEKDMERGGHTFTSGKSDVYIRLTQFERS